MDNQSRERLIKKESKNLKIALGVILFLLVSIILIQVIMNFWLFILKTFLSLFLIGFALFIAYKAVTYIIRFLLFTFRFSYKTAGIIVAVSLVGWVLKLLL